MQLDATGNYSSGLTPDLTNDVIWPVPTRVSRLAKIGMVTGLADGTTDITATSERSNQPEFNNNGDIAIFDCGGARGTSYDSGRRNAAVFRHRNQLGRFDGGYQLSGDLGQRYAGSSNYFPQPV